MALEIRNGLYKKSRWGPALLRGDEKLWMPSKSCYGNTTHALRLIATLNLCPFESNQNKQITDLPYSHERVLEPSAKVVGEYNEDNNGCGDFHQFTAQVNQSQAYHLWKVIQVELGSENAHNFNILQDVWR